MNGPLYKTITRLCVWYRPSRYTLERRTILLRKLIFGQHIVNRPYALPSGLPLQTFHNEKLSSGRRKRAPLPPTVHRLCTQVHNDLKTSNQAKDWIWPKYPIASWHIVHKQHSTWVVKMALSLLSLHTASEGQWGHYETLLQSRWIAKKPCKVYISLHNVQLLHNYEPTIKSSGTVFTVPSSEVSIPG